MLVLIDQCGCAGFRFTKGSTPFLVVGVISFKDFAEAEKAAFAVASLAESMGIYPEFKFNKTSYPNREKFIEVLCEFNFDIRVLIVDKKGMSDPARGKGNYQLYEYLTNCLIENNADVFLGASVKINRNMDGIFRQTLIQHLENLDKDQAPKKVKCISSRDDSLMQLVDMMTGTISKNFTDESVESYQLFNLLVDSQKIKSVWKIR